MCMCVCVQVTAACGRLVSSSAVAAAASSASLLLLLLLLLSSHTPTCWQLRHALADLQSEPPVSPHAQLLLLHHDAAGRKAAAGGVGVLERALQDAAAAADLYGTGAPT